MTAGAGFVVAASSSEAHFEVGILPLLLKRKRLIQSRIKLAREKKKVENLEEKMESAPDQDRMAIEQELKAVIEEIEKIQHRESEEDELEEKLKVDRELEFEVWQKKTQTFLSLLEKESVATILGSVLLAIITIALVAAMFLGVEPLEIVSNAFLVLLGYFFGQTITRLLPSRDA